MCLETHVGRRGEVMQPRSKLALTRCVYLKVSLHWGTMWKVGHDKMHPDFKMDKTEFF